jgi:hypothetical protein
LGYLKPVETGTQITARVHNKVRGGEIIEETQNGYRAEFHCPERVTRTLHRDEFVRSDNYSSGDV